MSTKVFHPTIPDIFYEVDNAGEWQESGWLLKPPTNAVVKAAEAAVDPKAKK